MKALLTLAALMTFLAAAAALPRDVRADMCPLGCAKQTRACLQTARTKVLTCRASCRSSSPGDRSCMRACGSGLQASKHACTSSAGDCRCLSHASAAQLVHRRVRRHVRPAARHVRAGRDHVGQDVRPWLRSDGRV